MKKKCGRGSIELEQGDITLQDVDAIVNAANSHLAGGGGVDGAIHRRGGPEIMKECRAIGGCPTGQTVLTTGGKLKARHVLHTVGPRWRDGNHGEPELLASCYRTALGLAAENGFRTVAFPSVSTGIYGYPVDEAAAIAIREIAAFLEKNDRPEIVRMVLFDAGTYAAYEQALREAAGSE